MGAAHSCRVAELCAAASWPRVQDAQHVGHQHALLPSGVVLEELQAEPVQRHLHTKHTCHPVAMQAHVLFGGCHGANKQSSDPVLLKDVRGARSHFTVRPAQPQAVHTD